MPLTVFLRIAAGSGEMTSFMRVLCTRPPYASGLRTRWTCHCTMGQQNVKRSGGVGKAHANVVITTNKVHNHH